MAEKLGPNPNPSEKNRYFSEAFEAEITRLETCTNMLQWYGTYVRIVDRFVRVIERALSSPTTIRPLLVRLNTMSMKFTYRPLLKKLVVYNRLLPEEWPWTKKLLEWLIVPSPGNSSEDSMLYGVLLADTLRMAPEKEGRHTERVKHLLAEALKKQPIEFGENILYAQT